MPPRKRPALISLKACEAFGKILASEEATRRAMTRIGDAVSKAGEGMPLTAFLMMNLARLTESSIIFAVDRDTLGYACSSLEGPPTMELPPLPFAQIVVEADTDDVWYFGSVSRDEADYAIEVFAIQEITQGKEWRVQLFIRNEKEVILVRPDGEEEHPWMITPLVITPEGASLDVDVLKRMFGESYVGDAGATEGWDMERRFAVEAVHFITAKGVSLALMETRAQRRDAKRHGYSLPERIYWVTVTDDVVNSVAGQTDRQYHCRWLVRGHWRHLSAEKKTWVRAYIKGPLGAPWRGRPIYHLPAA